MVTITRLIAVIASLCKMTATIESSRTDNAGNTYYTLAGIPTKYNEVKVSSRGGLWSDKLGSFHSVAGELVKYETEIAYRVCFPDVRLTAKNLRPAPAVITAPAPAPNVELVQASALLDVPAPAVTEEEEQAA
jgi:hypothetical protein